MSDIGTIVLSGVVGLIGGVLGAALNELVRRANRIEAYVPKVIEKRLLVYEKLLEVMRQSYLIADDVMENPSYSKQERHDLISVAILNVAEFCDANELYLDQELGPHCTTAFMGAEDAFDAATDEERQRIKGIIRRGYAEARRMIREDSGIAKVDRMFKRVAKPRISSPVIDHLRRAKKAKD